MKEIYFDSSNCATAQTAVNGYAEQLNRLAGMLEPYHINTKPDAMQRYLNNVDEIMMAIRLQQDDELAGMPELVQRSAKSSFQVDLTPVVKLMREMVENFKLLADFQRRAGRKFAAPFSFCIYDNGKYLADSQAIRDHFTVYRTPAIENIIQLADEAVKRFSDLKTAANKQDIHKIVGNDRILKFNEQDELVLNPSGFRFI